MNEYFDLLWEIYTLSDVSIAVKYKRMREWLERLCREQMKDESLQMTDISPRINFLSEKFGFDQTEQYRLHTFRLNSVRILNEQLEPDTEMFLSDLKTLALVVGKISRLEIPPVLRSVLPGEDRRFFPQTDAGKRFKRVRVCFLYSDNTYLYVNPSDFLSEEVWKVSYRVKGVNDFFSPVVGRLWPYAQLNLLDVTVGEPGIYIPAFIVLEPDYLVDISSLAECYKEYGSHPANYNLNKLLPVENVRPLLLGNIVNLFLDEWIHAEGEVDYKVCMQKAFRNYPLELAACKELKDREQEIRFFSDCRMHFEHIRQTVRETFSAPGYELDPDDAILEPSYICEALGIQGRLDYMQRDMKSFIEMKSGKADEYLVRGRIEPKENNKVQMLLYMAVLEYSMRMNHRDVHPYLLYTRYPLLYPSVPDWTSVKRVIALRNLIVAGEYRVQLHNDPVYTAGILSAIEPRTLNERNLKGKFWENYLSPSIARFATQFNLLTDLEKSYFLHLYNFITKELYLSKSGDTDYEGKTGSSSLWLSTLAEKQEAGEILYDLKLISNQASNKDKPAVVFAVPSYADDFLPNFRPGDAVVFYERNCNEDNVTNKMVFKGTIETLGNAKIRIRIRASQKNESVLPDAGNYAVEHDYMDTTFKNMFQGLYAFMTACKERRELLLAQRPPIFDENVYQSATEASDDFEKVALKALAAHDYFLLLGPPGTGKTSRALKRMVEIFHADPGKQILLLAYTNRAVDEICKSVSSINPSIDFIRIGNELTCDAHYRDHLLEKRLMSCSKRSEVSDCISACRILVGTVAAVSGKPDLFKLKRFDVAIVDEATQILEPQLLGILCAKDPAGKNAVGRFVLIGDHKQLPAVVLQDEKQSAVNDSSLQKIGLMNLKESLFERLYRHHLPEKQSRVFDMLCKQGRMNPVLAEFPNREFYGGKLRSVGLEHQTGELRFPDGWGADEWEKIVMKRLAFVPSKADTSGRSLKTNRHEARIAVNLALKIYRCYERNFDEKKTIGIITPYRSQIALIKKELSLLGIPKLAEIAVDTIERFQGSERDVIVYSFCINRPGQLKFISNLIVENGIVIDRKLNVALTRARKQLYIIGDPGLLAEDLGCQNLLKLIDKLC